MSIHIYTIYNNGSFVINFIKLFVHYIFSIFFFFFAIFTLFNFSSSSSIVLLDQSLISSNKFYFIFQFSFDSLQIFNFFSLYLLKFYVLHCSIFHLLPPFLFHLNFHINFFILHLHLSLRFLPSYPQQKGKYSLSFSNFFSLLVNFFNFFNHLFFLSTNDYYC